MAPLILGEWINYYYSPLVSAHPTSRDGRNFGNLQCCARRVQPESVVFQVARNSDKLLLVYYSN